MKSIDPSEIRVIEYLSGEMTREEVVQFEKDMKENPLLEQQLDELRATKSQLQLWGNEDIPSVKIVQDRALTSRKRTSKAKKIRNYTLL